jgi:uncharacterized membrane protein YeiB
LRGLALFGVLLVNLETLFRVSLFEQILHFHTDPGKWNHVVDVLIAGLLEFKAVSLFSLMFGIGSAIQAERAAARGVNVTRFLVRRYLVLLALGLFHLLLIWNGDILVLYAVCGLLIVPFLRLPASMLAALGAAVIVLPYVVDLPIRFPTDEAMQAQAVAATRLWIGKFHGHPRISLSRNGAVHRASAGGYPSADRRSDVVRYRGVAFRRAARTRTLQAPARGHFRRLARHRCDRDIPASLLRLHRAHAGDP